jgi:hypothetical protein
MTLLDDALCLFWLVALIAVSRLVGALLIRALGPALARPFLIPGVAVHELSHAAACLLTGARIVKIELWTGSGGSVRHTRPRWPVVTQPLISLAPVLGGVLVLWGLSRLLGVGPGWSDSHEAGRLLPELGKLVTGLASWRTWLFLFALVAVTSTLAPSRQDLRVAATGLLVIFGAGVVLRLALPTVADVLVTPVVRAMAPILVYGTIASAAVGLVLLVILAMRGR